MAAVHARTEVARVSAVAQQRYLVTLAAACTRTDPTSPVYTSPRAGLSSRVVGASDSELTTGHSFLGPIRPDPTRGWTRPVVNSGLTAVLEDPGSNHAADSCAYRDSCCDIQS